LGGNGGSAAGRRVVRRIIVLGAAKKPRPVGRSGRDFLPRYRVSCWTRRGIMGASRSKMFCRKLSRHFAAGLNLDLPSFVGVRCCEQRMRASSLAQRPGRPIPGRGFCFVHPRSLQFCRLRVPSGNGDGVRVRLVHLEFSRAPAHKWLTPWPGILPRRGVPISGPWLCQCLAPIRAHLSGTIPDGPFFML
jgi:hypothetical protein